eukprot:GEMP01092188.1.p1 GENE.GEMP01092188.1~~GEMP01092188.1.p1  ORF type:complete len:228 (+),score=32.20 GEMP01092188.1:51-686(+)
MAKTVVLQWMNGEKTTADACATVGDLRLQMCSLRECIWHDVALLNRQYQALEHDEADVPDYVVVVIKGSECLDDSRWKNTLAAHAKHEDHEGVRRVHRKMRDWGMNVAPIFRAVWIDECHNWNMERKMTLTAQRAGIAIKREGGNCAVLRACMKGDWNTLSYGDIVCTSCPYVCVEKKRVFFVWSLRSSQLPSHLSFIIRGGYIKLPRQMF